MEQVQRVVVGPTYRLEGGPFDGSELTLWTDVAQGQHIRLSAEHGGHCYKRTDERMVLVWFVPAPKAM